jgi:hypothetical protein
MVEIADIPTFIEILIVSAVAAMVLGDYLGYKIGRRRLAVGLGIIALVSIVIYAIYAAFTLT